MHTSTVPTRTATALSFLMALLEAAGAGRFGCSSKAASGSCAAVGRRRCVHRRFEPKFCLARGPGLASSHSWPCALAVGTGTGTSGGLRGVLGGQGRLAAEHVERHLLPGQRPVLCVEQLQLGDLVRRAA